MKKIKKTILLFLISFFLVSPFAFAYAENIVPCGNGNDPNNACTLCHLAKGIDNIVSTLMKWITTMAVVIIVVAGIYYMVSAGNPGMINTAKTALKNTLIGLAIALSAFVMIHFVLKAMAVTSSNTGPAQGIFTDSWTFSC